MWLGLQALKAEALERAARLEAELQRTREQLSSSASDLLVYQQLAVDGEDECQRLREAVSRLEEEAEGMWERERERQMEEKQARASEADRDKMREDELQREKNAVAALQARLLASQVERECACGSVRAIVLWTERKRQKTRQRKMERETNGEWDSHEHIVCRWRRRQSARKLKMPSARRRSCRRS